MEKKQTAVQMAIEHFKSINTDLVNIPIQNVPYILEQFLQTEREQIEEAFDEGNPNGFILKTGEDYYNETFKY